MRHRHGARPAASRRCGTYRPLMTGNPLWDLLGSRAEQSPRGRQRSAARVIPHYLRATGHRRPSMELLAAALADYASGLPSTLAERLCGARARRRIDPVRPQVSVPGGTSTTSAEALMAATASAPGSSRSSAAASLVMRETRRKGPERIST